LFILKEVNGERKSLEEVTTSYKNQHPDIQDIEIIQAIENLKSERIIYMNDSYSEIISIIDIDSIQ
jgi:hypothetical protein